MDTSFEVAESTVEAGRAPSREVHLILADESDPLAPISSALTAQAAIHLVSHFEASSPERKRQGQVRPDLKNAALARTGLHHPAARAQLRSEWEIELSCEEADWKEAFPNDPGIWAAGLAKFAELHFDKRFKGMGVEAYFRSAESTAREMLPEAVADSRAMLLDLWQAGQMSLPEIVQLSYRLAADLSAEIKELEEQRKKSRATGTEARERLDSALPALAKLGVWARRFGKAGRHLREAVKLLSEMHSARTNEEHATTMRDVLGELLRSAWQTASDTRKVLATLRKAAEMSALEWEKKARQAVPRRLRNNRAEAWNILYQDLHLQVAKSVLRDCPDSSTQGWSALVAMDAGAWRRALHEQAHRVISERPPPLAVRRAGEVDWAELIGTSLSELGFGEHSPIPVQIEVRASAAIPMLAEVLDDAETRAEALAHRPLAVVHVPRAEISPLICLRISDAAVPGMEAAWQVLSSAALTASFQVNRLKTVS